MVEVSGQGGDRDWGREMQTLGRLFDSLRPDVSWASRDAVHQTTKKVIQFLDQDLAALEAEAGFLFAIDQEAQGLTRQTTDILRRWHLAERAPSLTALSIFAIQNLKLKLSPEIEKSLLAASVLGEVENNLPYHNNMHYKKVLMQTIRLIAVHNNIYHDTAQEFDTRKISLLMLAACIHDLGHDGRGNTIKGVFEQGRLEKRAFRLAASYLESCGLPQQDLAMIEVMLLCTDVAPLGDPSNPVNQMKAAYRYHFLGQKKKIGPLNLDEELSVLQKDADLSLMALILHEADIGTSAGLDYNLTTYETAQLMREMGEEQAFPQDVVDFLNDICQRVMLSDSAQRLFAANMARIFALAEKEIADGNHAYPQPEYSEFLLLHHAGAVGGANKTIN